MEEIKQKLDAMDAKLNQLLVKKKILKPNHDLEARIDEALTEAEIYNESCIPAADIYVRCDIKRTHGNGIAVSKLMRGKGFTARTIKIGGKPVRVWREAPEVQL